MDPAAERLIAALHAAPVKCVLALTGGGTSAAAALLGVPERVEVSLLPGEQPQVATEPAPGLLAAFQRGEVSHVCQEADGRLRADGPPPPALLCGSFNPLHAGHLKLAEVARIRLGVPVAFELGAVNADKPPLTAG